MKVGILDQSPIVSGHSAADALRETIALAKLADELGYHRYWLAEHHAIAALADPCPEVLAARVAAETRRMRVGTGGVLLPHYSALKVAEVFRMLEALYPGRIDLGIGRAPGGELRTAQALARGPGGGFQAGAERFPEQVAELAGYLERTLPPEHPFARVRVQPEGPGAPDIWLLGSSDYSGALAAHLGLRFAFAHFIGGEGAHPVMRDYRAQFRPSARVAAPRSLLCVAAVCAETRERAERLAKSMDLRRVHMARGVEAPIPTLEEADAHPWSEAERTYARQQRARLVLGEPGEVRERLLALAGQSRADELMVLTITGDYASRRRSYELVAQAFELARADPRTRAA
ncbi:MAG: LLM class flavin-dependent oxidoreductase [Burkholderiales bacterium]|nr:LLM class flavin-dependent oxidoreductase [Burkholderiales bacterium]